MVDPLPDSLLPGFRFLTLHQEMPYTKVSKTRTDTEKLPEWNMQAGAWQPDNLNQWGRSYMCVGGFWFRAFNGTYRIATL
jgi:hypothetical protein